MTIGSKILDIALAQISLFNINMLNLNLNMKTDNIS